MQHFLIHAYDYTDAQALDRRMAARPAHFEGIKKLKETGNFVLGGAILNDEGQMIGSNAVLQFETKEDLQAYLAIEPYIVQKVWEKIDIKMFRVASI
ncbi:MAG: hypothetical protein EAZ08_01995 [Cytophagales bacterium]|nr:MAG: hypothetical protein EAZ08_01995 [Cytophagales bacterium]